MNGATRQIGYIANRVGSQAIHLNFKTINIFKGIAEIDSSLKKHLKIQIIKLILKSLKAVEKTVEAKIEEQKMIAESQKPINFRATSRKKQYSY